MPELSSAVAVAGQLGITIAGVLSVYGLYAVFFSVLFLGEVAVLIAFILAASGMFSLQEVFLLSLLAALSADFFWFFVSRYFPEYIIEKTGVEKKLKPLNKFLEKYVERHLFLSILFLKFFIGTRLIVIVFLGRRGISAVRFMLYDVVGVLLYIAVLALIGWYLGKGIYNFFPAYSVTTKLIFVALVFCFLIYLIRHSYLQSFKK